MNHDYGTAEYWRGLQAGNAARASRGDVPAHDVGCEGRCYRCDYDRGHPAIVAQVTESARRRGEAIQAEADAYARLADLAARSPTGRVAQDGQPC